MAALRRIALGILWLLATVGIACGLVWGATAAGLIKPLIVISGSMEPHIMTGDLVVDTRVAASTLKVGDVVSLPSSLTHDLVTHRIEKITAESGGDYSITLKGDNNRFADALDYRVGSQVWQPQLRLPGMGAALERMTSPVVVFAFLVGLAGLLGLVWLIPAPRRTRDDSATALGMPAEDSPRADAESLAADAFRAADSRHEPELVSVSAP